MKPIVWVVLLLLVVALWFSLRVRQKRNPPNAPQSAGTRRLGAEVYLGLRNLELQNPHTKIPGLRPGQPFAVVMDWGLPAGTATVAAYADGTASVYLSSGGGYIGGGESHESIRNAAAKTVEIAGELKSFLHPTTTYPLPEPGQVTFYVPNDTGVLTATVPEEDLSSHRSPLYKLGDSAQNIMTEYRLVQEHR